MKTSDVLERIIYTRDLDLLKERRLFEIFNKLYVDPDTNKIKKEATRDEKTNPGVIRRFSKYLPQLNLTHDVGELSVDDIIAKLPKEYDGFKNT